MKALLAAGLIAISSVATAQIDRSVVPSAGPAPTINIKDSEVFTTSNGITVILSENHKLPRVSFDLTIGAKPSFAGSKAGLSEFAGNLILSGTTNRSKDQLDSEMDYIGASLRSDNNSVSLRCLTKHMDKGLDLMSDALMNADFPQSEVDRIKTQIQSSLMSAKSDANTMASNASSKVNFPKHPYGEVMTEETLNTITRDDLVNYYNTNFIPKGSYLVVVGDIDRATTEKMVEQYFGSWKGSILNQTEIPLTKAPKGNRVVFVKKPGAVQSVVEVTFPIDITPGHKDQVALTVLNQILGGGGFGNRLMQNLREDKAFTYGAHSSLQITENGSYVSAGGSFRNEVTDSAITEILYELDHIINDYVTDAELAQTKASMAGSFGRSLENPGTLARFALNIIKYNLPKDYYQNYLKKLEAVSKEDLLNMAQTYLTAKNCNIVVVGNESIIDKLTQFDADGKVELLDAFGNEVKETIPADITADELLDKYVMATTKTKSAKELKKKLKKIKSVMTVTEINMAQVPFPLKSTQIWVAPNGEGQKLEGQGMVLQKGYFDGEKGNTMNMQTGKKDLTTEEIAAKKKSVGIIPEMNYKTSGMSYEIVGIEEMDGKQVYVLKHHDGETEGFDYYDKNTFMKVKSVNLSETEGEVVETTISYGDYKEVSGILMPHSTTMNVGEMTLNGTVTEIKVNSGSLKDFM